VSEHIRGPERNVWNQWEISGPERESRSKQYWIDLPERGKIRGPTLAHHWFLGGVSIVSESCGVLWEPLEQFSLSGETGPSDQLTIPMEDQIALNSEKLHDRETITLVNQR
jgi:hypothetical protein